MADEAPESKAPLSPSFSSYEGLGSTVLVTLANLIPSSQGRIIATVVAAPLGAALGRFISWKIQQHKRADVRLISLHWPLFLLTQAQLRREYREVIGQEEEASLAGLDDTSNAVNRLKRD
ncbi:MAG: hypothetical protein EOO57_07880 [Hymenobacter sp.]|nr:MAG: hypothetical protein EOO57_07880 [Hymenobacter sp.]